MKNKQISFFLIAIAVLLCMVGSVFAENPRLPTNNAIPVFCNFGLKVVATPTITLDDVTPIDLNDILPAGTLGFELRAKSGDFVINNEQMLATGTDRIGRLVSEGETYIWNNNAGTFHGSIIANDAAATVIVDGAWGEWSNDD